ncbi:hypothetical protein LCGC14_0719050 [marine sediment metagenome]|uniref:Uncharacterized protein n=1 Tax=marine sediment metagenome TaxID=412755 RepID=A0A0F9QCY9_9ZZZZ
MATEPTKPKPQQPTDAAIRAMLVMTDGDQKLAADRLGISRMAMLQWIRDIVDKPKLPKSRGHSKKKSSPEPTPESAGHLHEQNEVEQPTVSDLLWQGINISLDNGVHYEELMHRFSSEVLRIMQDRIARQRLERIKAAAVNKRWTPKRLQGVQDRLVNARLDADGTESDGTDEDEENAVD